MGLIRDSSRVLLIDTTKLVFSFVTIAVLTRLLPQSILGSYFLYFSVVSVVGTLGILGLGSGLEKRISEGRDQNEVFTAGLLSTFIIFGCISFIIIIFTQNVENYLEIPAIYVIVGLALKLVRIVVSKSLNGQQKVPLTSFSNLLDKVIFLIVLVYYYSFGSITVLSPVYAFLVSYFASIIFSTYYLEMSFAVPTVDAFRRLYSFSIYASVSHASFEIYDRADILLVGFYLSTSSVSNYEIAWQVSTITMVLTTSLSNVVGPKLSQWWANGKTEKVATTLETYLTVSILALIPAIVGGAILAPYLLSTLFAPEYVSARYALILLLAGKLPATIGNVARTALYGMDHPAQLTKLSVLLSVSNVVLNIVFIPVYGIEGAAGATAASSGIMAVGGMWMLSKYQEISLDWHSVSWAVLSTGLMVVTLFLMIRWIAPDSLPLLFVFVGIGAITYLTGVMLSPHVRNEFFRRMALLRS